MWQHQGFFIFFMNYGGLFGEEGGGQDQWHCGYGEEVWERGIVLYESSLEH